MTRPNSISNASAWSMDGLRDERDEPSVVERGFGMTDQPVNVYPQIRLKPERQASLLRGHPWLFSGAIAWADPSLSPGAIAAAVTSDGKPLGLGLFNAKSDIAFRLLTSDVSAAIDRAFWKRRIQSALALRQRIIPPETNAYRLLNAEGDGVPGLVADRYGEILVMTIGTAGIENHREDILDLLIETLHPKTVVERSEGKSRQREGLENRFGIAYGEDLPEKLEIIENGLKFEVDPVNGQKTGFFLDQRPNREVVRSFSASLRVLNCFAYTGAFSIYAASGGAERVISVDVSENNCESAVRNLIRNGFSPEHHAVIAADVFTHLRETDETFDMIILDPPAFAKTRADVSRAARGYKDINLQAVKKLNEGGLLATFSCSNHVDEDLFHKIVLSAVRDTGKTAQLLKILGPGPDHPTLLVHSEGRYLKGLLLRII
jgi:23S rRNA (cytosine1962-C5)-methyltransferase